MAYTEAHTLERLVTTLEGAERTLRHGRAERREEVLIEALGFLGSCYGMLGLAHSPEVAAHLDATYDDCIKALGDAFAGRYEPLVAATARARSILSLLAPPAAREWMLLAA